MMDAFLSSVDEAETSHCVFECLDEEFEGASGVILRLISFEL